MFWRTNVSGQKLLLNDDAIDASQTIRPVVLGRSVRGKWQSALFKLSRAKKKSAAQGTGPAPNWFIQPAIEHDRTEIGPVLLRWVRLCPRHGSRQRQHEIDTSWIHVHSKLNRSEPMAPNYYSDKIRTPPLRSLTTHCRKNDQGREKKQCGLPYVGIRSESA